MRFLPLALIFVAFLSGCGAAPAAQSVATAVPAPTTGLNPTPTLASTIPATPTNAPFVVALGPPPTSTTFLPAVSATGVPTYTYKILATYAHDKGAWVEGLVYTDGVLYEGTGPDNGGNEGGGISSLRRVNLETGVIDKRIDLPLPFYGEGIAVYSDTIVQLSWKNQTGFVYDRASMAQRRTFSYSGEGWGLTYDGQRLIRSDGTSRLHFLSPTTFDEIGAVDVTDAGKPVTGINELEYIDGAVYGNIYYTDLIARIDPQSGQVTAWLDLTGLLSAEDRTAGASVLNGIAYDAASKCLLVTGKLWPKLFAIELVPPK